MPAIAWRLSTSSYLDAAQRAQSWPGVSRPPQADIERWKARMGWEQIPSYTITDDFDADFGVAELHGHNVLFCDRERIFRTYFINDRGDEALGSTWSYLDITALGRQEGLGGLARGLPADHTCRSADRREERRPISVVEPPRRVRARHVIPMWEACRWSKCCR
jgi:Bacterial protein of unknown function (DUF899)